MDRATEIPSASPPAGRYVHRLARPRLSGPCGRHLPHRARRWGALHQALSLYLIDTLPLLNRESPDYPFDVLTLCEAIVEDPDAILRRQVDKLKTEKLEEMQSQFSSIALVTEVGLTQHLRKLTITTHKERVLDISLDDLTIAWRGTLDW